MKEIMAHMGLSPQRKMRKKMDPIIRAPKIIKQRIN